PIAPDAVDAEQAAEAADPGDLGPQLLQRRPLGRGQRQRPDAAAVVERRSVQPRLADQLPRHAEQARAVRQRAEDRRARLALDQPLEESPRRTPVRRLLVRLEEANAGAP